MLFVQNCNNINLLAFVRYIFILGNSEMYLSIGQEENGDHLSMHVKV